MAALNRLVAVLAYLIVHPGLPARLMIRAARRLEDHDATRVTTTLLGDPPATMLRG